MRLWLGFLWWSYSNYETHLM